MQSRNLSLVWIVVTLTAIGSWAQQSPSALLPQGGPVQGARVPWNAQMPLTFEANQGQISPQVQFLSRGQGYTAFLTAGQLVLSLRAAVSATTAGMAAAPTTKNTKQVQNTTLQFRLVGAARTPLAVGEDPQPGKVNYFIGNDPEKWHTNVQTYAKVRYKNVYPGIDLVYYGSHRQLEYDFAISPGADPSRIQFEIKGAQQIQIDAQGDLVLQTVSGDLHFNCPVVYQESANQETAKQRVPVQGAYVMNDATHIAFRVAAYDTTKPLVIDPVLVYSTYLGGSGNDQPTGIAVDSAGSVYVAGYTDSTNFPLATLGALPIGTDHVFVAKLDSTGSNLIYADYIGGNTQDFGYALVLDSANEVYVTGTTSSSNFPVVSPYQAALLGSFNGFLTKLSADGSSLLYSTYLGGSSSDVPSTIAIDGGGSVLVAGYTYSTDFPVINAYQATVSPNLGGLFGEYGFLTKFSLDGSSLVYSTYFGGNTNVPYNCSYPCWGSPFSAIAGIALDPSGSAYVAGNTNTYNFPTTPGAYLRTDLTLQNSSVGFVSKFSAAGLLDYSTYLYESSGADTNLNAIAVDGLGSAYVTGIAQDDGTFPVTSTTICNPSAVPGCNFAFVTKFDPTGSTLAYSTYLGPNNGATPQAIVLDASNDAYVLSSTASSSFSMVDGIEPYTNGDDLLLVEIDPLASSQIFATYLGGSANESAAGMVRDSTGYLYITGATDSTDFPVTQGAFQSLLAGSNDGFVLKIGPNSAPAVALSPGLLEFAAQSVGSTSPAQTVLLRNMGSSPLLISSTTASPNFAETNTCGSSVPAASNCAFSVTFVPVAAGSLSGSITIQDDAAGSPHVIDLSGTSSGPVVSLAPGSLTFPGQQVGTTSAAQIVTLTNSGNMVLSISNVQVTGNFAETNNCSTPVAASSSCAISITFTPTASGALSGTLTVSDSAANSPQTESLTGSESDFSLASAQGSDTVKAGSTATYNLKVSPVSGSFASAVALTCTGLPAQTSCSLSPNAVTPGGSAASSTLSIITTATVAEAEPIRKSQSAPVYAVWIQLQAIGLLGIMFAMPKRLSRKTRALVTLFLVSGALIFMFGCGGTGIVPPPQTGTAPGTYSITVTGTSGHLQHSLPLTLVVD
jgi:Beta-propeller repeat/Abnormal spindle-like microcephaly-assoc'd, ASPM-SPD-2-Hydin